MINEGMEISTKKIQWLNISFFAVTTLVAVVGTPLYLACHGVTGFEWLLLGFYVAATGLSVTTGYHRLFAHVTYKAHPLMQFLLLFFGAAAFEQSALKWASQHRDHHLYVDTERDPYNIKKGFFYAHIGWLIFWQHKINFENVPDLKKNALVMHQHRHYLAWAVISGILVPVLIGALFGNWLGAFIFGVCLRLTIVYHATFCINSVCHMFGKATYDIRASAKDHWLAALLTYGEGYHNFHHRFPSDYRNGIRWFHWDPTKWLIALMAQVGLAQDLRKAPPFRIWMARLAADGVRTRLSLQKMDHPALEKARERFNRWYEGMKKRLVNWETACHNYQAALCRDLTPATEDLKQNAYHQMCYTKARFNQAYRRWSQLVKIHPLDLKKILPLASVYSS